MLRGLTNRVREPALPIPKVKESLVLTSLGFCAMLGLLDILVDIGVPAEKEVIL